jgi:hypothetical protein
LANELAQAVQSENKEKILEIWASLVTDQERTVATWSLIGSQTRTYIKKTVKENQQ